MTGGKPFDPEHAATHDYTCEDWDALDVPEMTDAERASAIPFVEGPPRTAAAMRRDLQHEAGDRAFVAGQHFADFVRDHPFVAGDPQLAAMASDIEDRMGELYQAIWRAGEDT